MVDDGFVDLDVVINEWDTLVLATLTAKAGDATCALAGGTNDLCRAIDFDLDLFLFEGNEFGINGKMEAWLRDLNTGFKRKAEGGVWKLMQCIERAEVIQAGNIRVGLP